MGSQCCKLIESGINVNVQQIKKYYIRSSYSSGFILTGVEINDRDFYVFCLEDEC